jgi:peptidoglycan hydrolase CwlO-like protein
MVRSVIIFSLLAATLAAIGGVTALVTTNGQDKEIESLSTTLADLQEDLKTALAMVQQLTQEKVELSRSLKDANERIWRLKRDFEKAADDILRLEAPM